MADLGTPAAAGSATPNPAAAGSGGSTGKQPMTYICGGKLICNLLILACQ